jgi:hypothetical protein
MPEAHPFSSYKRWGRIIGGMMNLLEFGDPTQPHETDPFVTSDQRTAAMKAVFELLYSHKPELWIDKKDVTALVATNQEEDQRLDWFGDLSDEITKRKASKRLGQTLAFFHGRWLSDIRFEIDPSQANIVRRKVRFTKSKADP